LLDKLVGAKLTLGEEEAAPLPALEVQMLKNSDAIHSKYTRALAFENL
jgi:hypothetical protein